MTQVRRVSLACAALVLLAACGASGDASNAEANAAANDSAESANAAAPMANEAAPAAAPAAAGSTALTADYMIGKWSAMTDGDCSDVLDFRKDGTVKTPFADAKWSLNGDMLSVDFGDGSKQTPSRIKPLGPDKIEITTGTGRVETQSRCP